jgi:hypothetical protein
MNFAGRASPPYDAFTSYIECKQNIKVTLGLTHTRGVCRLLCFEEGSGNALPILKRNGII